MVFPSPAPDDCAELCLARIAIQKGPGAGMEGPSRYRQPGHGLRYPLFLSDSPWAPSEQLARLSHPVVQATFLTVLGVLRARHHRRTAIALLSLATVWI